MTVAVATAAKARIVTILAAALPDVDVRFNEPVDTTDGPVILAGGMTARIEPERLSSQRSRFGWEWGLTLGLESKRWHPTAADAEAEVAEVSNKIFETIADNPNLDDGTNGDLAGVEMCWVDNIRLDYASHGEEPEQGGAEQYAAKGAVDVYIATRSVR